MLATAEALTATVIALEESNGMLRAFALYGHRWARCSSLSGQSRNALQRDRNQVVDPAGGALVFGDDQLERSGFRERLALAAGGHQYAPAVNTGIGFRDGQHHGVSIRP